MTEQSNTNYAVVSGEIISDFRYSHDVCNEQFYKVQIRVPRLSEADDVILLVVSGRLLDVNGDHKGKLMEAEGQFRSYNAHDQGKNRLVLFLFVRSFRWLDSMDSVNPNQIYLDGYICKEPYFRKTHKGREICDILIAVNRAYARTDYIPCICWGRNARYVERLPVGSRLKIHGRIQSRSYIKLSEDMEPQKRVAYEISVYKLEYCAEDIVYEQKVAEGTQQ